MARLKCVTGGHLVGADAAGLLEGRRVAVQQLLAGVVRGAPVVGGRAVGGGRCTCTHVSMLSQNLADRAAGAPDTLISEHEAAWTTQGSPCRV